MRALKREKNTSKNKNHLFSVIRFLNINFFFYLSKRLRDTLKDQISQKDQLLKKLFETKSLEYKYFMEQDRMALEVEKKKRAEKFEFMKTYRDENKQVINKTLVF